MHNVNCYSYTRTRTAESLFPHAHPAGDRIALNSAGDVLASGAYPDGAGGVVWIFKYNGTHWNQYGDKVRSSLLPSSQGRGVSLSASGQILAIGAPAGVGASMVFRDNGTAFVPESGVLVGTGNTGNSEQGRSVSISAAGDVLAVGGV